MKIDILIAVAFRGGVEQVISKTAVYLMQAGHKVRIVHALWQGVPWADPSIEFHYLHDMERFGWDRNGELIVSLYRDFMKEQGTPDLILAATWPVLVPITRKAAMELGKDIPVVSWLHGNIEAYEKEGFGSYPELKYAQAHLAINEKFAKGIYEQTGSDRVYCVKNPVDVSRIRYSEDRNPKTIAFVGRLATEKNLPFLFRAFAQTSGEWQLEIVGDGDPEGTARGAFERYAEQLGIRERVHFHGWAENPWELLTHAGELVLTSDREGSPLVLEEALLCGMTVISTPTDGPLEWVKVGENGYLVPFGDDAFLAKLFGMIGSGMMPRIPSEKCRNSVAFLLGDEVLTDLERKLRAVCEGDRTGMEYAPENRNLYSF